MSCPEINSTLLSLEARVTAKVPDSLLHASDEKAAIDASYFVLRALRNKNRGYSDPVVSREAPPKIRALAERALREIEKQEKKPMSRLDSSRIFEYIDSLEEFQDTTYGRAVNASATDTEEAASLLEELRSTEA